MPRPTALVAVFALLGAAPLAARSQQLTATTGGCGRAFATCSSVSLSSVTWSYRPVSILTVVQANVLGGGNGGPPTSVVPEPGTMTLVATALAGLAGANVRRRRQKA